MEFKEMQKFLKINVTNTSYYIPVHFEFEDIAMHPLPPALFTYHRCLIPNRSNKTLHLSYH